jgi:hypothetical protein
VESSETYPISLKTILRTKEAIFDPLLQTSRALKGSSVIVAIVSHALPLCHGLGVHDGSYSRYQ